MTTSPAASPALSVQARPAAGEGAPHEVQSGLAAAGLEPAHLASAAKPATGGQVYSSRSVPGIKQLGSPSQPPPRKGLPIDGTWVLQQVSQTSDLNATLDTALSTPGIRGFSMRVPWSSISTSTALLDLGLAKATGHNVSFSVRLLTGQYTPAAVFAAGSPSYTAPAQTNNTNQIPTPFNADGSPNSIFEGFYQTEVTTLAAYARAHGGHLLHLGWYGAAFDEIYLGSEVMSQPGYTYQHWLTAYKRLVDIGWNAAGDDLSVEYPLSGVDNTHNAFTDLTNYMNLKAAGHVQRLFGQSNGLGQPTYGMQTFGSGLQISKAQQMFDGSDYDWNVIYGVIRTSGDVYVEVYATSLVASLAHNATLLANILTFAGCNPYKRCQSPPGTPGPRPRNQV